MAMPLSKTSISHVLKEVHPGISISTECTDGFLQMLMPINDLFTNKNSDECVQLINEYIPGKLGEYAHTKMAKDMITHPNHPPRYGIIEYLEAEILVLGGNITKDRNKTTITMYDIYASILQDEELKQIFQPWLIPKWIVTDITYTNDQLIIRKSLGGTLSRKEVTDLCRATLIKIIYEDKVLDCIYNILEGCTYISGIHPIETAVFSKDIPIPMIPELTTNPIKQLQMRILGLVTGAIRHTLQNRTKVTFIDIIWATKSNIYYPKFIDFLSLTI
jgi:hypothetical protein